MKLGDGAAAAGQPGVSRDSQALLNALRPFCMSAMMALEGMLHSGSERDASKSAESNAVALQIAAGRRLEAALTSLHSALVGITSPSHPATGQAPSLGSALAPVLPFLMLPLQLALAPAKDANNSRGGGGGRKMKGGRGEKGGKVSVRMPAAVREKALMCVTAAVRACGSRFVEGYGVRPTINVLIGLVFTISECSPTGALSPSPVHVEREPPRGSAVGRGADDRGSGVDKNSRDSGSGLTASTDALRLACLECLEALMRAPFEHPASSSSAALSRPGADPSAWSEVRDVLRNAVGGGIMAQLVQELLLCCCQGDASAVAGDTASRGGGKSWGGLETAHLAAKCLDALSSFASGASTWRRFLPGTFSGLFRAIRGVEMNSGTNKTSAPALTSIWLAASTTAEAPGGGEVFRTSSRGGGSSGASKSVVAETCLSVLTKVLLMCAGMDTDVAADCISTLPRSSLASRAAAILGPSGGDAGAHGRATKNSENPLVILERMAKVSNAQVEAEGRVKGSNGHIRSESDRETPSKPAPMAKSRPTTPGSLAKSLSVKVTSTSPEDPAWEAQTSDRLRILLPPLLAMCRLHPGWRVRCASAAFASALLAGSRVDGGSDEVEWGTNAAKLRLGGEGAAVRKEGLLGPLVPLLMEGLVGLAMDDMPQVSTAAHRGIDHFRSTLSPLQWLSLRGMLLERLCAIVEGLPAVAKSADEKRLRLAFDLLAGYLSLLGFDARAALDARLPTVISCLCEALEFDQNFNVQVLEGSHDTRALAEVGRRQHGSTIESDKVKIVSGTGAQGGSVPGGEVPKYYRRVLANVREDATAASARRAVRLLGTYCDLASVGDAILSSLETRYPRRQRPRPSRWNSSRQTSPAASTPGAGEVGHPVVAHAQLQQRQRVVESVPGDDDNGVYQKRCLEWLRPRLPMAWVLNQALLGRVPVVAKAEPADGTAAAVTTNTFGEGGGGGGGGGGEGRTVEGCLGRGLAADLLERLLASRAFSLPVTWAETTAVGDNEYFGDKGGMLASNGSPGQGVLLPKQGRVRDSIGFTRSGELLGGDRGSRVPGFSSQVLDANATLVSTVIEALASLAEASGPGFGEAFLRRALYPLLEKVASGHPVVSQAALATLWRVRSACGKFNSMSQLLELNMDYVVDDVIRRVATRGASSRLHGRVGGGAVAIYGGGMGSLADGGVPGVVEAVLRIGGSAMGPALVRDLAGVTLREVDACAWDPRQTRRSLRVLRAVASCVSIPSPSSSGEKKKGKGMSGGERSSQREPLAAKGEADNSGTFPGADEGKASECAVSSTLAKSPWFRQLFVEFAEPTDVRRASERGGSEVEGLVEAFREHQQAMGFDEDFSRNFDVGEDAKEEDEIESLPEPDEEGRKMAESQEVKTLSEVLSRSCHFLATPSLQIQALALACMRDCVRKLASAGADAALLPHVHRAWRPLMASFREHLTPLPASPPPSVAGREDGGEFEESLPYRRAILLHSLETVDALVDVCGDFLSTKVCEDLWPLLKVLLLQYTTSTKSGEGIGRSSSSSSSSRNAVSSNGGGYLLGSNVAALSSDASLANTLGAIVTARSPSTSLAPSISARSSETGGLVGASVRGRISLDEKVVVRALECLEGLCRSEQCERFMTPLAREVAITALPCLSSSGPDAVCSSSEALFRRLAFLDGDSVWLLLLQTMDTAAATRGDARRHGGIRPPSRAGLGLGGQSSREGGSKISQFDVSGTGVALVATEDDLSHFPAISAALKREPPCMLAERKSVFDGVRVAIECAPAARRLLGVLNAIDPASEHM